MKGATLEGAMPEKLSVKARAIVTAGLAKDVDDVNQYAATIYDAIAPGSAAGKLRRPLSITVSRPNVATNSPVHCPMPERACADACRIGRSNIRCAIHTPRTA